MTSGRMRPTSVQSWCKDKACVSWGALLISRVPMESIFCPIITSFAFSSRPLHRLSARISTTGFPAFAILLQVLTQVRLRMSYASLSLIDFGLQFSLSRILQPASVLHSAHPVYHGSLVHGLYPQKPFNEKLRLLNKLTRLPPLGLLASQLTSWQ